MTETKSISADRIRNQPELQHKDTEIKSDDVKALNPLHVAMEPITNR